jgi:hypothetical protein
VVVVVTLIGHRPVGVSYVMAAISLRREAVKLLVMAF